MVIAVDISRWSRRASSLRHAAASASRVRRSRSTAPTTQGTGAALHKSFCDSADRVAAISGPRWPGLVATLTGAVYASHPSMYS